MIFEILLHNKTCVYMSGVESEYYALLIVDTEKIKLLWDARQMNDRSKEKWYMDKYINSENHFKIGKTNPVPASIVGGIHDYGTPYRVLRLDDGITRIQWLLDHGAEYFPVHCPKEVATELAARAGIE